MSALPASSGDAANWTNTHDNATGAGEQNSGPRQEEESGSVPQTTGTNPPVQPRNSSGLPIRRVRHAEVVLVDDVCIAFERYWLRLRWPGHKGGFAGYIALGKVGEKIWLGTKPTTGKSLSILQNLVNCLVGVVANGVFSRFYRD